MSIQRVWFHLNLTDVAYKLAGFVLPFNWRLFCSSWKN